MSVKLISILSGLVVAIGVLVGAMSMHVVPATPTFGAAGGTVNDSKTYSYNGVEYDDENVLLAATSAVPFSVQPTFADGNGTSTVQSFDCRFTGNGLGTQTVDVSTSTSAQSATSSLEIVRAFSVNTAPNYPLVWNPGATTTSSILLGINATTGQSDVILKPGQFLQMRIATATPGTFAAYLSGYCHARFRKL